MLTRPLARVLEEEFVFQTDHDFAKWDFGPGDFVNLLQVIEATAHIAGAYVEIGCYEGSSAGRRASLHSRTTAPEILLLLGCFRRI